MTTINKIAFFMVTLTAVIAAACFGFCGSENMSNPAFSTEYDSVFKLIGRISWGAIFAGTVLCISFFLREVLNKEI